MRIRFTAALLYGSVLNSLISPSVFPPVLVATMRKKYFVFANKPTSEVATGSLLVELLSIPELQSVPGGLEVPYLNS